MTGSLYDPKPTNRPVKHSGERVVTLGSLTLIDGSSRIGSEDYRNVGNASNLIGRDVIVQKDNNPKHAATSTECRVSKGAENADAIHSRTSRL